MNRGKLTSALAKRFFFTLPEAEEIIAFICSNITKELKTGERVSLHDFGSFVKENRKPKTVRHPKTGELTTIPERIHVEFKPSKELLKKIK